jgi:hypothetical protein
VDFTASRSSGKHLTRCPEPVGWGNNIFQVSYGTGGYNVHAPGTGHIFSLDDWAFGPGEFSFSLRAEPEMVCG